MVPGLTSPSANRLADARARVRSAAELLASGRAAEARSWLEEAINLAPSWAEPHVLLAKAQMELDAPAEAEQTVRAALEADPEHAGAAHLLGLLLFRKDQLAGARAWFQTAVNLAPDVARYHRDLGVMQLFFGQIAEGRATLQRALTLDPLMEEVVDTLAHILPAETDGAEMAFLFNMLTDLAERPDLPTKTRAEVYFGMSKIHERRGEVDEAFASLAAGNALVRGLIQWDADAEEQRFRRVAEIFDPALFERLKGAGAPDPRPIFVVGMPRSGSTLVEQILSAHSQVHGAGETDLLLRMVQSSRGPGGSLFPEWSATMVAADCPVLAGYYLEKLPKGLPGQTRTTDKRLENFEYLGLIHLLMPGAKIIHCRRDPRDSGFSALGLRFSQGQEYSYDMVELGRYWRAYDALMDHWREVLPPGVMIDVQYEDLVADLEGGARRLIAHCGLEWDDACLRFHEAKRPVRSASLAQVREPIFTRSIGRWKPYAAHLKPMFDAMGLPEA
jgi:Tfp pilus assembly protein PilF